MAEKKKYKVGQTGWRGDTKYRWNGTKWEQVEASLAELSARQKKPKRPAEKKSAGTVQDQAEGVATPTPTPASFGNTQAEGQKQVGNIGAAPKSADYGADAAGRQAYYKAMTDYRARKKQAEKQ